MRHYAKVKHYSQQSGQRQHQELVLTYPTWSVPTKIQPSPVLLYVLKGTFTFVTIFLGEFKIVFDKSVNQPFDIGRLFPIRTYPRTSMEKKRSYNWCCD